MSAGMGKRVITALLGLGVLQGAAVGQIRITEYMYTGNGAEFVEFTNLGAAPVDFTGWSYDDNSNTPGSFSVSAFGVVAPGESVIVTDAATDTDFRTAWGLAGTVKVVAGSNQGLGRDDQINLYDNNGLLVAQLTYGDTTFPGTIRTQFFSGWPCAEVLGDDTIGPLWNLSSIADQQLSFASSAGDVGSPGSYVQHACGATPVGACCALGACTEPLTQFDCEGAGGVYQGDGSLCINISCPAPQDGNIRITEYMYTGNGAEFVEITNMDVMPIDMSGWSLDDDSQTPGTVSLTGLGTLMPGQSGIITDGTPASFIAAWTLVGVPVVQNSLAGFGRDDEINIFNAGGILKDRLTYSDQNFPGTIRTQFLAGWPCQDVVGTNTIAGWQYAQVGDSQGSVASSSNDIGSPGVFVSVACNAIPTGACCNTGACTDETATSCILGTRQYQGDGTNCGSLVCPAPTGGMMRITEYMYSGNGGEYIEFTNLDVNPIDMTNWSFDDDSATPGVVNLSAFGVVNPGESVILSEGDAATFATDWNLAGVDIIGSNTTNLGRNDQITLFDAGGAIVDVLTYGDQTFPGTIRTQNLSGFPCDDAVGQNDIFQWFLSSVGDQQNSYASASGDIGNPGTYVNVECPTCGNGVVEVGEDCDGGVCCTPNCTYVTAGTECRSAAGPCDAAEACTGSSADCPADGLQTAGFECRASAGDCDIAELCDGVTVDCPMDGFQPSSLECRASAGVCDPAEFCTGGSADCPGDAFEPSSTECRASAGDCDVAEFCNGEGADCPVDEFAPNTVVCRPAVDACDLAETCTGADVNCPGNTFAASGTQCADDGDACTSDVCDGNGLCNHPENGECGACCTAGNACQNRVLPAACTGQGGASAGAGSTCLGDADGDGVDDLCDECPGVDDAVFAPGCAGAIPTVSEWGLIILALSLLVLGKVYGAQVQRGQ